MLDNRLIFTRCAVGTSHISDLMSKGTMRVEASSIASDVSSLKGPRNKALYKSYTDTLPDDFVGLIYT